MQKDPVDFATFTYWNNKYKSKEYVWGLCPSISATRAIEFLSSNGITEGRILDLGCGYGRDSAFFSKYGFDVVGIDVSREGINKAKLLFPEVKFKIAAFMPRIFEDNSFDIIFANFFFHLFNNSPKRIEMIQTCHQILKPGGYLFASVACTSDADYVNGQRVGANLVKNERGVTKYFYDDEGLRKEFSVFHIENLEIVEEHHSHDRPHTHVSYFIVGYKTGLS